jgi:hypothetical protein
MPQDYSVVPSDEEKLISSADCASDSDLPDLGQHTRSASSWITLSATTHWLLHVVTIILVVLVLYQNNKGLQMVCPAATTVTNGDYCKRNRGFGLIRV